MNTQKRIKYSRKLSENIRKDFFKVIYESFHNDKFHDDCETQNNDTVILLKQLMREFDELQENRIETKQDLIRVFLAHYYLIYPKFQKGVLSDIDLMLELQLQITVAESQKADLAEENRVLKEKIKQLEEESKEHKSLFIYHSENQN